jgi:hypothetical protein
MSHTAARTLPASIPARSKPILGFEHLMAEADPLVFVAMKKRASRRGNVAHISSSGVQPLAA